MKPNSYSFLKERYADCVILILAGCFYEAREEDALIINKIFKYRIYEENYKHFSRYKTGFPTISLENVLSALDDFSINYIVVESYEIVKERLESNNLYSYYSDHEAEIKPIINKEASYVEKNNPISGSKLKNTIVKLNNEVTCANTDTGEIESYKIISNYKKLTHNTMASSIYGGSTSVAFISDADPELGTIGSESPMGKALLGNCTGDEVQYRTPSNEIIKLLILDIK